MDNSLVDQYRILHSETPGYGTGSYWRPQILEQAGKIGASTVLDMGCGKGRMVHLLRKAGLKADGFDPSVDEWNATQVLQKTYDMVLSVDVAEHWAPGTVKPELKRLRDLAIKQVFLVISCRSAHHHLPDGRNCHLSVHPPEWWKTRVEEVFPPALWTVNQLAWKEENKTLVLAIARKQTAIEKVFSLKLLGMDTFDHQKTIAVVGNGPLSPGDRERIESADVVIRFNDWNRRRDFDEARAGTRCDFLFTQFDANPSGPAPETVCVAIPAPFHIDRIIEKSEEWYRESSLLAFNPYVMRIMCRDVLRLDSEGCKHPIPTVGFQMLYWLHLWSRDYNMGAEIFVTGFTWHVDIETATAAKIHLLTDTVPRGYNHTYLREVKWLAGNIVENRRFQFSEKTRDALYYVRWLTLDQGFEKKFHSSGQGDWRYDPQKWEGARKDLQFPISLLRDAVQRLWGPGTEYVLDVGSGPRSMLEFLDDIPPASKVAIEPLGESYVAAEKGPMGTDAIYPIPAETPVPQLFGKCSAVWCHNVLDHCHNWRTVLRNIDLYLTPGGRVYIGTDDFPARRGHLGFDSDIVHELQSFGYSILWNKRKEKSDPAFYRQQMAVAEKPLTPQTNEHSRSQKNIEGQA